MRKCSRVFLSSTAIALLALAYLVLANEVSAAAAPVQGDQRVVFVTDQKAGIVRFVIDGKEIARIDATGLYVHGDVACSGTITDGLPLRVSAEGQDAR